MIKYIFLAVGSLFFVLGTKFLTDAVRNENLLRGFVRSIDTDGNGLINSKEVKEFMPCENFNGKMVVKALREVGRKASVNDMAEELSVNQIMKQVKKCPGNYDALRDIEHIKGLKAPVLVEEMFNTYDMSNNDEIRWAEYHIVNLANKGSSENTRNIFKFLDKNHDWKITRK